MALSMCPGTSRRDFLTKVTPACAAICLGCAQALAQEGQKTPDKQESGEPHPFDAEYGRKLTYRQVLRARYREAINLAQAVQKEMGDDEAMRFLRAYTRNRWLAYGKTQAEKAPNTSLRQYTEQFRNVDNYKNTLRMKVVEDTDQAFELAVSECLWASTFIEAGAADLGYALVCYGDYAWAEGFNPKIKLVRDKTLMEGQSLCNHRYIWQG